MSAGVTRGDTTAVWWMTPVQQRSWQLPANYHLAGRVLQGGRPNLVL